MLVRILRVAIIAALLFSYLPVIPVFSMDECQAGHREENEAGTSQAGCGYVFHCPVAFDPPFGTGFLSYFGQLIMISSSTKVEEPAFLIFHPPE